MTTKEDILNHRMKAFGIIRKGLKSKIFKYFVLFCIISSIASIVLSSFEDMNAYRIHLFALTYFSSFIFLIEYILRIVSAPFAHQNISTLRARLKYVFSFYGLVDFDAILPFLLVYLYWNSEIIHIIILPYIFTIFKLIRYSKSFKIIGEVLSNVKEELVTAYTVCGILICFSAILMYYIERNAQPEVFKNIGESMWWSIVALTTVGYGDIYPITPLGKVFGSIISLIGIAMIALPTGIICSSFMRVMENKQKDKDNEQNNKDEKR